MKNIAAIDVGSNSVLLQIVETHDGKITRTIASHESTPRISEGLKDIRLISKEASKRLVDALTEFKSICDLHNAAQISCYGTSALREALNSRDVISSIKEKTGITIEVISGEREAALTYLGASKGMADLKDHRILIDAGGGSSEIVIADKTKISAAKSFRIGAVTLTEEYETNELKSKSELDKIRLKIERQILDFDLPKSNPDSSVIVSGGTPTAIAAFSMGHTEYEPDRVHGINIKIDDYRRLIYELGCMTLKDRRYALSFEPKRADVITAGGLLSLCFAEQYNAASVRVSERGLRFGQLYELLDYQIEFA